MSCGEKFKQLLKFFTMKLIQCVFRAMLFVAALASCKKEDAKKGYEAEFDAIPAKKYSDTDAFQDGNLKIYGTWKIFGTSGGIHGGGYPIDFDFLLVKPNQIFGIVRNDSLMTHGEVKLLPDPVYDWLVEFDSEKDPSEANVQLIHDPVKFIQMQGDTLYLFSLCCDRFDTHLIKVK